MDVISVHRLSLLIRVLMKHHTYLGSRSSRMHHKQLTILSWSWKTGEAYLKRGISKLRLQRRNQRIRNWPSGKLLDTDHCQSRILFALQIWILCQILVLFSLFMGTVHNRRKFVHQSLQSYSVVLMILETRAMGVCLMLWPNSQQVSPVHMNKLLKLGIFIWVISIL